MTEEEWTAKVTGCRAMLHWVKTTTRLPPFVQNRKYRLLAVSLARSQRPDETLRRNCELVERYVDGFATQAEFREAQQQAGKQTGRLLRSFAERRNVLWHDSFLSAIGFLGLDDIETAGLIREIFGNPFRPIVFFPDWRTSTAVAIASQMYESRDFSAMPILADALQDGGCDNEDVLTHCRDVNSVHVRGCWVVDAVLGKS